MLDSICAPQVLVHLVHLSISACTGISTSQTNAQVRMQQAKRVHTHTQAKMASRRTRTRAPRKRTPSSMEHPEQDPR